MQTQTSLRERGADPAYSTVKTHTACPGCHCEAGLSFPVSETLRARLTDRRLLSCGSDHAPTSLRTHHEIRICQELYENWDWKKQCEFSASLGYTGMELAPFTLAGRIGEVSQETRAEYRKIAEDHGLQIIGLHWLLAKTEGLHLTTSDAAVRKATSDYLIELGQACADFGGTLMVFGSPFQRNVEDGMTTEQAMANAAEIFKAACLRSQIEVSRSAWSLSHRKKPTSSTPAPRQPN